MARTHGGEEIDRSANSTNYTEFTVKKSINAKTFIIRALLILVYIGVVVGLFLIAWPLGAISALVVAILAYFTWPLTCVEYEYTTSSGSWRFEKILGGKRRTLILEKKIKDMKIIAPYTPVYTEQYKNIAKTYDFRKGENHTEDIYFAVFSENGKDNMIIFQCTNKALKIFSSYNKEGTVKTDTLQY